MHGCMQSCIQMSPPEPEIRAHALTPGMQNSLNDTASTLTLEGTICLSLSEQQIKRAMLLRHLGPDNILEAG